MRRDESEIKTLRIHGHNLSIAAKIISSLLASDSKTLDQRVPFAGPDAPFLRATTLREIVSSSQSRWEACE